MSRDRRVQYIEGGEYEQTRHGEAGRSRHEYDDRREIGRDAQPTLEGFSDMRIDNGGSEHGRGHGREHGGSSRRKDRGRGGVDERSPPPTYNDHYRDHSHSSRRSEYSRSEFSENDHGRKLARAGHSRSTFRGDDRLGGGQGKRIDIDRKVVTRSKPQRESEKGCRDRDKEAKRAERSKSFARHVLKYF